MDGGGARGDSANFLLRSRLARESRGLKYGIKRARERIRARTVIGAEGFLAPLQDVEFISNVDGSKHGKPHGIDGRSLLRDRTNFRIDVFGKVGDVFRVSTAKVI